MPVIFTNFHPDRCSTIDYIFLSEDRLQVTSASIVADIPHPDDERLYPSDQHFGNHKVVALIMIDYPAYLVFYK